MVKIKYVKVVDSPEGAVETPVSMNVNATEEFAKWMVSSAWNTTTYEKGCKVYYKDFTYEVDND